MGGSGAPKLRKGASVTGISTITQAVVGNATINAGGINATGIVTSSSNKFVGDLASGNVTAGVMTATSSVVASNITINSGGVNASGIISATSYIGSGANLTGIGLTIAPLIYSPELGATKQALKPTIELSFNQRIKAGSGNVVLRMVGAGSTVIENFGVGSSVTINNDGTLPKISFTPTNDMGLDSVIYVDIPAGAFKTISGTDIAATNWTFTTENIFNYWGSGYGSAGIFGNNASGPSANYSSPVQITATKWGNLVTGSQTRMGVRGGTLWAWGNQAYGGLGNNVGGAGNSYISSPVQIPGTTWSKNIVTSYYGSRGVKTDGTLWVWGYNAQGQLGLNQNGAPSSYSSPVQVPGTNWATGVNQSSGFYITHVMKSDGTLWCLGGNDGEYGTKGIGTLTPNATSSPVQIPGTTWSTIRTGLYGASALKTDGTLWLWGQNASGQLGQNDRTYRSSPIQVPGTYLSAYTTYVGYSSGGVKTDGTLWVWGRNLWGELGQNDRTNYSSPVQIPGTTWTQIAGGGEYQFQALKSDGTLWAIGGENDKAHSGLNNRTGFSSPTQIPGTTWQNLFDGGMTGFVAGKP